MQEKKLAIYQAKNGTIELNFDDSKETVWATQKKMAEVFGVTSQNITIYFEKYFFK